MANLITLSRLLLLFCVVVMAMEAPPALQLLNVPLLIVLFVTDALDGYVARRYHEASLFGAVFDIAADRIVEYVLWIVLALVEQVPLWVPLVFIVRGTMVDSIRSSYVRTTIDSPFGMMRTALGKWLVAGRFMRVFYAVIKAVVFCWLMLLHPLPALRPDLWAEFGPELSQVGRALVYLAVFLCLGRGFPVIAEFVYQERESVFGRLGRAPSDKPGADAK